MDWIIAAIVGVGIGALGLGLAQQRLGPDGRQYSSEGLRQRFGSAISISADGVDRKLQDDALTGIHRSPLVRVIAVGEVQSSDGATVECISLELREGGGIGLLRGYAAEASSGPRPAGATPTDPTPSIADDLGTTYRVTMPSWTGDDRATEMVFRFAPTPPVEARRIFISAPRTPPLSSRWMVAAARWVFEVDLVPHSPG